MPSLSKSIVAALSAASLSFAMPIEADGGLLPRQVSCTFNSGQTGTCISTSACRSQGGTPEPGHCPGAANIQCCTLEPVCGPPEVNEDTVLLIKGFEGFMPTPYPDAGKYSIGYGHQCSQPHCTEMAVPIDEPTAVELMKGDLLRFRKCLTAKLGGVALNEYQYGALISWTYNVGCGNMESSTLVRRLVADEDANTVAGEELPKWRLSQGQISQNLVRRRQAEIAFFEIESTVQVLPATC